MFVTTVEMTSSAKTKPNNLGLIKHQEKTKEGFYEKDTVSGCCPGNDGSSDTLCFGSSKVPAYEERLRIECLRFNKGLAMGWHRVNSP